MAPTVTGSPRELTYEEEQEARAHTVAGVVLGIIVGGLVWAYARADDTVSPTSTFIRFAVIDAVIAMCVFSLLRRPWRESRARTVALIAAMMVALVALGTLPGHARTELRAHETELTSYASDLIAAYRATPDHHCADDPATVDAGDLGPFDHVCVSGGGDHPMVEFSRTSGQRTEGLIFRDPKSYYDPDTCVRQLTEHFWQFVRPADPECPSGYTFWPGG